MSDRAECKAMIFNLISSLLLLATCQLVVESLIVFNSLERDSFLAIGINPMTCLAVVSISFSFFSSSTASPIPHIYLLNFDISADAIC